MCGVVGGTTGSGTAGSGTAGGGTAGVCGSRPCGQSIMSAAYPATEVKEHTTEYVLHPGEKRGTN